MRDLLADTHVDGAFLVNAWRGCAVAVAVAAALATGVTTQPVETVMAVLAASRDGASVNAAAKASGINYRTAQRIVRAVGEHQQHQLLAVG